MNGGAQGSSASWGDSYLAEDERVEKKRRDVFGHRLGRGWACAYHKIARAVKEGLRDAQGITPGEQESEENGKLVHSLQKGVKRGCGTVVECMVPYK